MNFETHYNNVDPVFAMPLDPRGPERCPKCLTAICDLTAHVDELQCRVNYRCPPCCSCTSSNMRQEVTSVCLPGGGWVCAVGLFEVVQTVLAGLCRVKMLEDSMTGNWSTSSSPPPSSDSLM